MSIAFGAIIFLLLFLPGILFRFTYLKSNSLRGNISTGVLSEIVFVVVPGLIFHVFGVIFVERGLGREVNFDQLYYLLVPPRAEGLLSLEEIEIGINGFLLYIFVLSAITGFFGYLARMIVLKLKLDHKFPFFRVYNELYRYFMGYVLPRKLRKKVAFIQIDVVTIVGGQIVLYKGMLENYTFNEKQGVDQLTLYNVFRRSFQDDRKALENEKTHLSKYYEMPGDYFLITFDQVQNFNVTYHFQVLPDETTDGAAESRVGSVRRVLSRLGYYRFFGNPDQETKTPHNTSAPSSPTTAPPPPGKPGDFRTPAWRKRRRRRTPR